MSKLRDLLPLGPRTDYSDVKPAPSEKPEDYAARVIAELLPTFRNRDEALDALYLCYPFANIGNLRLKLGAAIYLTRHGEAKT